MPDVPVPVVPPAIPPTWDGLLPSRPAATIRRRPSPDDWQNIVDEVILINEQVLSLLGIIYSAVVNNDPLVIGQPLAIRMSDGLAIPANMANPEVAGIAVSNAASGESVIYLVRGRLAISDWTAVTGSQQLLVGSPYFLGISDFLTPIPPDTGFVVELGRAQTNLVLDINIKSPIFL